MPRIARLDTPGLLNPVMVKGIDISKIEKCPEWKLYSKGDWVTRRTWTLKNFREE